MAGFINSAKAFVKGEEGATMVEYGLMLGLIAVVCLAGFAVVSNTINTKMQIVSTKLTPSGGSGGDGGVNRNRGNNGNGGNNGNSDR